MTGPEEPAGPDEPVGAGDLVGTAGHPVGPPDDPDDTFRARHANQPADAPGDEPDDAATGATGRAGGPDVGGLEARLAAERAGAEHWRRVARHREDLLVDLKRRPAVRVALALDRRTAGLRDRMGATAARLARRGRRLAVTAAASPRRAALGDRRRALAAAVAARPPAPTSNRPAVVVVVVGGGADDHTGKAEATGGTVATGAVGTSHAELLGTGIPPVAVVEVAGSERDVEGAVDRAVRDHPADLVVLVRSSTAGLTDRWTDRLAATLDHGAAVAAAPVLVHPERPLTEATEHDLLVRAAGLSLRADDHGVPVATAVDAGEAVGPGGTPHPVDAVAAAALVVDRTAYLAAGGLASLGDLDAAVVDLCVRLRAAGGDVVVVPDALVTDASPVPSRAALTVPVDPTGGAWRRVVERQGAGLLPPGPATFAITVAAPSAKVAPHWGDWHLARAMAAALERLGHPVRLQTADQADSLAGRACAVHVVVRGLAPVAATPGQRHVLWVISHPEDVEDAECDAADLVVVASSRFADHLRTRTSTPVEVLLQATDPSVFRPTAADPRHRHDVTVVARSRDVMRPAVADALAAGLRPAVYGSGWADKVPDGLVVAEHVDHEDLPAVYASAGVVLNDHWDTMRTWGFVSNRIFDVAACGTPVLSDDLPELHDLFDGLVPTWQTPQELAAAVADLRTDPEATRARTARLRALVLEGHTFDHRAHELLAHLRAHLDLT